MVATVPCNISLLVLTPTVVTGQNDKAFVKKFLTELPSVKLDNNLSKYRMTAVYMNRGLYGKFQICSFP